MINIGIGVSWAKSLYSVANNIIANFKARVLSYPNSIFEAGPCLDATLEELNAIGLLDNASLIITPNAYNEGVLYDVIPNTPLGDMDVVRATTATRVNSAGLIEIVPRNFYQYSEQFNNAYWNKTNCSISENIISAPNGTMTADKLIMANGQSGSAPDGSGLRVLEDIESNSYIYSIYAKAGEFSTLRFRENQITGAFLTVDLTNGTIINGDTGQYISPTAELITNGWYRISFKAPVATALYKYSVRVSETGNGTSGIYIWGYQVENSASLTEYFPTTTRLNIPRLDYLNSSCPSLLVEPQRTNLCPTSSNFGTIFINVTASRNVATAPNGNNEADRLLDNNADGEHLLTQNYSSITNGTVYTYSCFFKSDGTGGRAVIRSYVGNWVYAVYNLDNGTITFTDGSLTASIQNFENGWYRCILTATAVMDYEPMVTQIGVANSSNQYIYQGVSNLGLYFYGYQAEQGAYATSYIPTVASAVTRNADVISKTGISALIGQSVGTIFSDFVVYNNNDTIPFNLVNNNWNSGASMYLQINNSGNFQITGFNNTILIIAFDTGVPAIKGERYKCALVYNNTTIKLFINGDLITINTIATPVVANNLFLSLLDTGIGKYGQNYNSLQLYKTALSDSELAQLTTV